MRIGTKLSIAFSLAAAFLLAAGIAAVIVVGHLDEILNDTTIYNFQLDQVGAALRALRVSPEKTTDHLARLRDLERWARTDAERKLIAEAGGQLTRGQSVSAAADRVEQLAVYYRRANRNANAQLLLLHQRAVSGLIIVMIGSILLLAMLMLLCRHWLLNPIVDIQSRLAGIAAGDFQQPPGPCTDHEFTELSASVDKIAASLKDLDERASKAEKLAVVGEACSHVSHNMRNLLNSIRTLAHYESSAKDVAPDAHAAFGFIIATVDKLDGWMRDLLSTVHPTELKLVPQQLEPVIRDSLSLLEPSFAQQEIDVHYEPADELPAVMIDRALLEQALIAVLANAIDASPRRGRIIIGSSGSTGQNGCVSVDIRDEGDGMTEVAKKRAFEPFFTTKTNAAGLGLTIAHNVITRHHGSIEIESVPDKGTRVLIRLPAA